MIKKPTIKRQGKQMNGVAFSETMIWIFSFTTLFAWLIHIATKNIKQKGYDKKAQGGLGGFYFSMFALVASIGMYWSAKSDNDALVDRFQKGNDIYCYESLTDAKWIKVNKHEGWYLEDETLKNREKGLKVGVFRCKEGF